MLQLMHREWLRPVLDEVDPSSVPPGHKPSPRVLVVLLFWTFFETMMGRFYETAASEYRKDPTTPAKTAFSEPVSKSPEATVPRAGTTLSCFTMVFLNQSTSISISPTG